MFCLVAMLSKIDQFQYLNFVLYFVTSEIISGTSLSVPTLFNLGRRLDKGVLLSGGQVQVSSS